VKNPISTLHSTADLQKPDRSQAEIALEHVLGSQAFIKNQERGGPLGPGIHHFVAASYAALGDSAKARATLDVADLLENADNNWENWVRRSWKNPEDSDRILELIEQIRKEGV